MVAISYFYNLCALGLRNSPTVRTLKDQSLRSLKNECYRLNGCVPEGGYVLNPCEMVWVVRSWIAQDEASQRARSYMVDNAEEDSVGEYLLDNTLSVVQPRPDMAVMHGSPAERVVSASLDMVEYIEPIVLELRSDVADIVLPSEVENGVVAPDLTPLVVKQHRRIRKVLPYGRTVLADVRCKFGVPVDDKANRLAVRRYALSRMVGHGVRPVDMHKVLPMIVAMAFVPSDEDILAEEVFSCSERKRRLEAMRPRGGWWWEGWSSPAIQA